jgi:hypothetical protein
MKLKFLFSILFIGLSAIVSFAQTDAQPQPRKRLDISISSENPRFFINSGAWLVKVKITNRANETLNLKDFREIHFTFAKTLPASNYEVVGFYDVPKRVIEPGETFEFEADLKKLDWLDTVSKESKFIPRSENQAPFQPALSGLYTVFAAITEREEAPRKEDSSRTEIRSYSSNMLAVKVALKADK